MLRIKSTICLTGQVKINDQNFKFKTNLELTKKNDETVFSNRKLKNQYF